LIVILKALTFFSPLVINEIINNTKDYGQFEFTLNLGQTLMGIFSMGFAGSYAFFVLKNKRYDLKPIFHIQFIVLTFILLLLVILNPLLLDNVYFGAVIIGVAFADQILISSILKLSNKNHISVIIDTGIYILMAVIAVCAYFNIVAFSNILWHGSILCFLIAMSLIYHFRNISGFRKLKFSDISSIYKYGGLIVISSPLLVLLSANTRLFIKFFLDFDYIAIYSIFFRVATVILIIYRLITILLYRRIFMENHKKLDHYYSLIIIGLFIINFLIYLIAPLILDGYYYDFTEYYNINPNLFLLCLFQIIFWINTALFEPIIQRENQVKLLIVVVICCLSLFISSLFIFDFYYKLSIDSIISFNIFFIFLLFYGQQWILSKQNIFYKKTTIAHSFIGLLFMLFILIN
tara:strand:+ start:273 stop:1490 length:1218 start_codon:yes stop_codon:yes gene_type:complete